MKILGIETSCDETAAAVVEDGTKVLSNVIASQIPLHRKTGGVVPEVAAREHVVKINPVVDEALKDAGIGFEDIDAIAVTQGPGLLSSLIIGMCAASTLAILNNKPLIPVNHIAGHIYANWLDEPPNDPIRFPIVVMTVSGGHNELVLMKSHTDYEMLGETLDDAAGEAFDKVARMLGLGYPGGPYISKVAENGDPSKYKFPRVYLDKQSYDFSFSGLKTAVLNVVKAEMEKNGGLSEDFVADCAASFQEAVCEVLADKLLRAAREFEAREVHLAGGVSANTRLRELAEEKVKGDFILRYAKNLSYCTDNAAMIASAAFVHYKKSPESFIQNLNSLADPNLNLYRLR
jgi:N6-L-threonylcarbamoyladenine synthase